MTKIGKFQIFLRSSVFTELQNTVKSLSRPDDVGPITPSLAHEPFRLHPDPWASTLAPSQGHQPRCMFCSL